jgi:hypothetical protein
MSRQYLIVCALAAASASNPLFAAGFNEVLAAQAAAQISRHGGVTLSVEPRGFPREGTWDFVVTLETHTEALDDDLIRSATLFADGKPYRPLGWQGSPPGGHHRKGVLRFKAVTPPPHTVELRIGRDGETRPRVFRWQPGQHPW